MPVDNSGFQKIPELFDYNKSAIEEYHTPSVSAKDATAIALYEALNAADWAQTRQIARQPEKYSEKSLADGGQAEFTGEHPSVGRVNTFHLIKALGQPYIASKLSEPYKSLFQILSIGLAGNAIRNNTKNGLDVIRW